MKRWYARRVPTVNGTANLHEAAVMLRLARRRLGLCAGCGRDTLRKSRETGAFCDSCRKQFGTFRKRTRRPRRFAQVKSDPRIERMMRLAEMKAA